MNRTSRAVLVTLAVAGLLGAISLGTAARDWTAIWRGFDSLTMSVDGVEVSDDRRRIELVYTFVNSADRPMRIHALESGTRLSGRTISGGSESYNDLVLDPGEGVTIRFSTQVSRFDVDDVDAAVTAGEGTWNVSGRVRVSVDDLSDSLWLPFRSNVSVRQ
jgi:hypothetical protein